MPDETKMKVINATMKLISEKGYTSATTRDIAKLAGVNEVTIFRKFGNKKGIILDALKNVEWLPELGPDILEKCTWSLEEDLKNFAGIYLSHFTKENAKVILGLRDPQIFPEIKEYVLKLPNEFKNILVHYFNVMKNKNKIAEYDSDFLAGMFIVINFGYIITKASFDEDLISINNEKYIEESIKIFAKGISL